MSTTKTTHSKKAHAPTHIENSTDATRGEPLAMRARMRKAELEIARDKLPASAVRMRMDIELALESVNALLTGDTTKLSDATASELSHWLEHTKHFAEKTPKA